MNDHLLQQDEFKARLDAGLWGKVFRRALHLKGLLVPLFVTAVVVAMCDAGFALITRWVIDGIVAGGFNAPFARYFSAYLGLTLVLCTGVWVFIDLAGNISNRMAHDIRRDGFDRLQQLEFAFFDTRPVGWLITRLTSDCDRLSRIIAWGFLDIVWGVSYIIMIAASLLIMNWRLGLVVLAILPPLAVVSKFFQRKMLLSSREIRKFNSQITASFNESIQGIRTTKTLARERENLSEFKQLSGRMFGASVLNSRQNSLYYPVVMAMGSLAAGLALWKGGYQAGAGAMSIGTLVAFINFAGQFFFPINQLALRLTEMQGAQAAGERVMGLLATEPAIADSASVRRRMSDFQALGRPGFSPSSPHSGPAPDGLPSAIGSIEFRGVTFRYASGPVVLENFNLTVRTGETLALVGSSGGGKSTIVSLICRFYEPTEGQILLDGADYRERPLGWLQSQLGIVLQTPHLFKGTVRDNIRYGRLNATDAEIEEAACLVNADTFISRMEHGYDSQVGEGGNRLSTGQRQLLSFARALIANPQIFIMDEATSSIDTETEQLIQAGLTTIFRNRTSFVVAHRLSTIRRADRILVINKGRIEESGTHEELLRAGGHYHNLYVSQFRREQSAALLDRHSA